MDAEAFTKRYFDPRARLPERRLSFAFKSFSSTILFSSGCTIKCNIRPQMRCFAM
jgi:hypothetical protein